MTLNEIITLVGELKPNQFEDTVLIGWINAIEGKLVREVFCMREEDERIQSLKYSKYDELTDMDTELLVPDPYTDL